LYKLVISNLIFLLTSNNIDNFIYIMETLLAIIDKLIVKYRLFS